MAYLQANQFKFGRKARTFDSRIPHASALRQSDLAAEPPLPVFLDNTRGMPQTFGLMGNDRLGDCTCAAYYHARQIWTYRGIGTETTEAESDIERLYSLAAGYEPNAPLDANGLNPTDKGVIEQVLLNYLHTTGAPIDVDGHSVVKVDAFTEVDVRAIDDIKRTIYDCGVAYIGFAVPRSWLDIEGNIKPGQPSAIWDAIAGDTASNDGHAVILTGYNQTSFDVISWGAKWSMTYGFLNTFVDEAYALTDQTWAQRSGRTLFSLPLEFLIDSMSAIKPIQV
jgi:hypothetical protein